MIPVNGCGILVLQLQQVKKDMVDRCGGYRGRGGSDVVQLEVMKSKLEGGDSRRLDRYIISSAGGAGALNSCFGRGRSDEAKWEQVQGAGEDVEDVV